MAAINDMLQFNMTVNKQAGHFDTIDFSMTLALPNNMPSIYEGIGALVDQAGASDDFFMGLSILLSDAKIQAKEKGGKNG